MPLLCTQAVQRLRSIAKADRLKPVVLTLYMEIKEIYMGSDTILGIIVSDSVFSFDTE